MSQSTSDAPGHRRFTSGEPVPATIPADLRALLQLSEAARSRFGEILGPCLQPKVPDDADRMIEAFGRKYDTVGNHVAHALRGSRYVIWEAAKANASSADLRDELVALTDADAAVAMATVLLPIYEAARDRIRGEVMRRAIADHGTMVVGVDWRLDRVVASQHARELEAEIAVLTFSCREGSETRRVTLQLDREMLGRLRGVCERMLGG
jgi:hypothetical protein